MSDSLFDPVLLDRCRLTPEAAAQFRAEARQCIRRDEETGARVVCYVHPDGRVLIDAVRPPRQVRIARCSVPGAWYEGRVGDVVEFFALDSYGYWTRDTGPMRLAQWVAEQDGEPC